MPSVQNFGSPYNELQIVALTDEKCYLNPRYTMQQWRPTDWAVFVVCSGHAKEKDALRLSLLAGFCIGCLISKWKQLLNWSIHYPIQHWSLNYMVVRRGLDTIDCNDLATFKQYLCSSGVKLPCKIYKLAFSWNCYSKTKQNISTNKQ